MNSSMARGTWQQLKGRVEVQWGRVTRDPLRVVQGRHLQMIGRLDVACAAVQVEIGRQLDSVQRRSHDNAGRGGHRPMLLSRFGCARTPASAALTLCYSGENS